MRYVGSPKYNTISPVEGVIVAVVGRPPIASCTSNSSMPSLIARERSISVGSPMIAQAPHRKITTAPSAITARLTIRRDRVVGMRAHGSYLEPGHSMTDDK